MYPYNAPSEAVRFTQEQCKRFKVEEPHPRVIDTIFDVVLTYVSKNNYYPTSATEAACRYEKPVPLSEMEKVTFIGPAEYKLKLHDKLTPSLEQMHLVAWASLLWCWSAEGIKYVSWKRGA